MGLIEKIKTNSQDAYRFSIYVDENNPRMIYTSDDYAEVTESANHCQKFYDDFIPFVYDKEQYSLLDIGEDLIELSNQELSLEDKFNAIVEGKVIDEDCKANDDIELHKQILDNMHNLYIRKNHDYGNSFSKSFNKYGITSGLVRMEDKWNRLNNLVSNVSLVQDEKIEDTLIDLANYSVMLLMELRKGGETH